MNNLKDVLTLALILATPLGFAQQGAAASGTPTEAWQYKTKRLGRAEVDALLATPEKLLVIDVRRPDELTAKGGFPVYLNIQAKDLEKSIAYISKERAILTVSNHAKRAGAAGDLLASKGFTVAGATGSEDYEEQGGKAVVKIAPPPPRTAAAAPDARKDW